ncbi:MULTISPECIES: hypothetical protein [unclassified Streptomyces]|uniref:hypothetical protein n=1 Tax=unclassified Streptomyces TaxID=2593676 RepID=UPI002E0E0A51|nr:MULTISPECIES: hypothetical protein [unclassified Streptomyces]WSR29171.1 hypothetical protein OG573_42110 [Streptomyces sp. NBC_01205]
MKRLSLPVRIALAAVITAVCSTTAAVAVVAQSPEHSATAPQTVVAEPSCPPVGKCTEDTSWGG